MNYKISLLVLAICNTACSKKNSPSYPYLNAKMNEEVTISVAEINARTYENAANGRAGSYGATHTKFAMIYEDKAEVNLGKDKVYLRLIIRVGGDMAHNWVNNTSEDERINSCKQVCFGNIQALAAALSCDPKLVEVEWDCPDGNIKGTATGEESLAARDAEQADAGQTPIRPELKPEEGDKPQPEAERSSR